MSSPVDFPTEIISRLGPLSAREGNVCYSSWDSLRTAQVAFVGYNPGGTEGGKPEDKITAKVRSITDTQKNDYLTRFWSRDGQRHNLLQKRTRKLFEELGIDPNSVWTTNLYFPRSRNTKDVNCTITPQEKEACWRIHEFLFEHCPASCIICNGLKTFEELLGWALCAKPRIETERVGLRVPVLRTEISLKGKHRVVYGLRHMSYPYFPLPESATIDRMKADIAKA